MKYWKVRKHEKMADEFIHPPEKLSNKQKGALNRIIMRQGLEVNNAVIS